jgi:hypothetical protein
MNPKEESDQHLVLYPNAQWPGELSLTIQTLLLN